MQIPPLISGSQKIAQAPVNDAQVLPAIAGFGAFLDSSDLSEDSGAGHPGSPGQDPGRQSAPDGLDPRQQQPDTLQHDARSNRAEGRASQRTQTQDASVAQQWQPHENSSPKAPQQGDGTGANSAGQAPEDHRQSGESLGQAQSDPLSRTRTGPGMQKDISGPLPERPLPAGLRNGDGRAFVVPDAAPVSPRAGDSMAAAERATAPPRFAVSSVAIPPFAAPSDLVSEGGGSPLRIRPASGDGLAQAETIKGDAGALRAAASLKDPKAATGRDAADAARQRMSRMPAQDLAMSISDRRHDHGTEREPVADRLSSATPVALSAGRVAAEPAGVASKTLPQSHRHSDGPGPEPGTARNGALVRPDLRGDMRFEGQPLSILSSAVSAGRTIGQMQLISAPDQAAMQVAREMTEQGKSLSLLRPDIDLQGGDAPRQVAGVGTYGPGGGDASVRNGAGIAPTPANLALQLAEIARNPGRQAIEIRLAPEELGRVRIVLNPGEGGLHVAIQSERPETLELLRRNAAELARELADLGYQGLSLAFSDQRDDAPPMRSEHRAQVPEQEAGAQPVERAEPRNTMSRQATGLDLRI